MKSKLFNNLLNLLNSNDDKSYNLFKSMLNNDIELRKQFLKQMFKYHENYNEIDFDNIHNFGRSLKCKYHFVDKLEETVPAEYYLMIVNQNKTYETSITTYNLQNSLTINIPV